MYSGGTKRSGQLSYVSQFYKNFKRFQSLSIPLKLTLYHFLKLQMAPSRPFTPPSLANRPHTRWTTWTPSKRGAILEALMTRSQRQVAAELGMPKSTIADILKHYRLTGIPYASKAPGRPPCYNDRAERVIYRHADTEPFAIVNDINHTSAIQASVRTTRRLLHRLGLEKRPAKRGLRLTKKQAEKRLAFARYWLPKASILQEAIFSDETSCNSDRFGGSKQAWTPQNNKAARYERKRMVMMPHVKAPISVMAWAAISPSGKSPLIFLSKGPKDRGYKAPSYTRVLEEGLLPFFQDGQIFQQDNAPIHAARITKSWLQEHNIEPIEWPPNSPDLNPIENVWKLLKEELWKAHGKEYPHLRNNKEHRECFCQWIREAWMKIEEEKISSTISSLPKRLQAVVEAEGWQTCF
jgi:transposase